MNLFLNSTADAQTVTFLTNAEVCALGRDYCNSDPNVANQLPIDPHTHEIATGLVTIHNGIHLLLHGEMTIANLVTIQGTFTFTFEANPFVIQVTADASIGFVGIGDLAHRDGRVPDRQRRARARRESVRRRGLRLRHRPELLARTRR